MKALRGENTPARRLSRHRLFRQYSTFTSLIVLCTGLSAQRRAVEVSYISIGQLKLESIYDRP